MDRRKEVDIELAQGRKKAAKPMLWVSIISMVMFFAGLTSAYVISMKRDDWVSFDLPSSFYNSTILIVISSITLFVSQRLLRKNKNSISLLFLILTLFLGLLFVWFQWIGFNELKASGLYFTGPGSTVSTSFIIGITLMHVLHLAAGIITLTVIVVNHIRGKYNSENMLGFELGSIFWHFVDVLWIYLFFFFYFIR